MRDINQLRMEKRFCSPAASLSALFDLVKKTGLTPIEYSDKKITQTVYLLDDEQIWSLGVSLKARRFLRDYSSGITGVEIGNCDFRFEIKTETSEADVKQKEIQATTLNEATELAREIFPGIRPYLLVEYQRQHFVQPKSNSWYRVTIDDNLRFWFFPAGEAKAICIKDFGLAGDIIRLEIKVDPAREQAAAVMNLINGLAKIGAQPIISKKFEGLNAIKFWLDKTASNPMTKELPDCEIEAKLTIATPINPNAFFASMKNLFVAETKPIVVDPTYPFTMTTASVNHYWRKKGEADSTTEGIKILSRGTIARPVLKSHTTLINQRLGIIERKEIKGKRFLPAQTTFLEVIRQNGFNPDELEYLGYCLRSRKAIWLSDRETGRIYHVSLDRCTARGKNPLYQIEIEYSGILDGRGFIPAGLKEAKEQIIKKTTFLAEKIIAFAENKGIKLSAGEKKINWLAE